jgi:hypothetical protein
MAMAGKQARVDGLFYQEIDLLLQWLIQKAKP